MFTSIRNLWTGRSWVWLVGGLLLAGAIHIVTVLAMPRAIQDNGWGRVMELASDRQMKILPEANVNAQLLPFLSPDMRYAVCRFDLGEGAVVLRAKLRQPSWHLSLFNAHGGNFYTVAGSDIGREELDLVLTRRGANVSPPKGLRSDAILLEAPPEEGFAVLFAPMLGTAYRAETLTALKQANCS